MKFLTGKFIEERVATCNWCGIEKECFKATIPVKLIGLYVDRECLKLDWFKKGFFGLGRLYWAAKDLEYKEEHKNEFPDICLDCIKELSKLRKL